MVALMAEPSFIKNWASWLMNVLAEAPSKVTNGINKILFNPSNAILISKCTVKKLSSLVLTYQPEQIHFCGTRTIPEIKLARLDTNLVELLHLLSHHSVGRLKAVKWVP